MSGRRIDIFAAGMFALAAYAGISLWRANGAVIWLSDLKMFCLAG